MFVTRKNEFAKFNVVKMDTGDSPLSSGAIINLIATSVVERNASNVQDYDFFFVFFFMNRDNQGVKYWWWAHLNIMCWLFVDFQLNTWAFHWPNLKPSQLYNHSTNLQTKNNGMIPWMCRCSTNAWNLQCVYKFPMWSSLYSALTHKVV